jgi:hypothetical protein
MKLWKGARKPLTKRPPTTAEAIEAAASAPTPRPPPKPTPKPVPPAMERVFPTKKPPPTPAKMPKRTGLMTPKDMDKHIEAWGKNRQRNDFRNAQLGEDKLLRNFAHAHVQASTTADPNFHLRYFPAFADLPIPRAAFP